MSFTDAVKRVLIGRRLASAQLGETLLPKRIALPVIASDALSSVAYAPDEILLTLSVAGLSAYAFSLPIAIAVAFVMLVVVASYRQTVHAYPNGGGGYAVASENLGPNAGLVVASALLVDYVLTVAVSVSSGVQNARAVFPAIAGHEGLIAAVAIVLLTTINLRGVRESGKIFAIPTYAFMFGVGIMVIWGLIRIFLLGDHIASETADLTLVGVPHYETSGTVVIAMLLLRTFSSGCAALTGVEAVSNAVPSFRPPKTRNAATTLALLGGIAVTLLLGIVALARATGVKMIDVTGGSYFVDAAGNRVAGEATTVMGQLSKAVFYDGFRPGFYFIVGATVLILFLAANTAFSGFPTLGSILARDEYLPKQLHTRGDRLAFSNGIIALALAAVVLVITFDASVTALIQLYVVGVFVSFTLSQAGMIRHWGRALASETDPAARFHMQRSRIINTVGLVCTAAVLIIVLISKFTHGAYLSILAMAVVFVLMKLIHNHYAAVEVELALHEDSDRALPSRVRAVVLVSSLNKPTVKAVQFAKATQSGLVEAITVAIDPEETERMLEQWDAEDLDVPLKVIDSPYRRITQPVIDYVRQVRSDNPREVVCVYIPEFVVGHWWEQVLHNQTALMIRARLHFMPGVMITSVPYQLASSRRAMTRIRTAELLAEARAEQRAQES